MSGEPNERVDFRSLIKTVVDSNKLQADVNNNILDELRSLKSALLSTNESIGRISTLVESHEKLLRGNGREGLVSRMDRVEPLVDEHEDALRGVDDKPGLVGRVSALDSKSETISRPLWLVLASLIGAGISTAVNHFFK